MPAEAGQIHDCDGRAGDGPWAGLVEIGRGAEI
jgi:hypothetical protein